MYMDCCIERHIQDLHMRREEYSKLFGSFNHLSKVPHGTSDRRPNCRLNSFMRSANFMKHLLPGKLLFIRGDKL